MAKYLIVFAMMLIIIPSAFAITLKDLIDFFSFDFSSDEIRVTGHNDSMADNDGYGMNDTLIIEMEAYADSGSYVVLVDLHDETIMTNETNKTLPQGTSKFNISFSTEFLVGNGFNYTIKIFDGDYTLKFSEENIQTANYSGYEKGITILNVSDRGLDNSIELNITINSTKNASYDIIAYLQYNESMILSMKDNQSMVQGLNNVTISFDNETIKGTHHIGQFNLSSIKFNGKIMRVSYATREYDYRDFAQTSFFSGFSDDAYDADGNGLDDYLAINATMEIKESGLHEIEIELYDLLGNFLARGKANGSLNIGTEYTAVKINGTEIYEKKLDGPFIVKSAVLKRGNETLDSIADWHMTKSYNYTDFEGPELPDISITIVVSDEYHYGSGNFSANVTILNSGKANAFNVFIDIFGNNSYSSNESKIILRKGENATYKINFSNASDIELNAVADFDGFVEEHNESNNIANRTIKINMVPILNPLTDVIINESNTAIINATASDPNGDSLSYLINDSRFAWNNSIFSWKTGTTDAGNYTLRVNASDGYLSDHADFTVIVLDLKELDFDDDGINDSLDRIIGMPEHINTTINTSFLVGNSTNISRLFEGVQKVEFRDSGTAFVEFDFNFSNSSINLSGIMMEKQNGNGSGAAIFGMGNITLPPGFRKTIYLDRLNSSQNGVCIKDAEIRSFSEITNGCNGADEYRIECDSTLQESYNCTYIGSTQKYRLSGLRHSGIRQLDFEKTENEGSSSPASSSGGSSYGSAFAECTEQWSCTAWSECSDNMQTRQCSDSGNCGTNNFRPGEKKECQAEEKISPSEIAVAPANNIEANEQRTYEYIPKITGFAAGVQEASPGIGGMIIAAIVVLGLAAYQRAKKSFK